MQRNGGFGRTPEYAARRVLRRQVSRGYIGELTAKTHLARFRPFAVFMKETFSIRDMTLVEKIHVVEYAQRMNGEYSAAYAQNLISTVNVVLVLLTHRKWIPVSPAVLTGKRRNNCRMKPVMIIPPGAIPNMLIGRVPEAELDHLRMIDFFGLRAREAALIDVPCALREIELNRQIDVRRGTKGGRGWSVGREVPVSAEAEEFLRRLSEGLDGASTIIPEDCGRDQFLRRSSRVNLPALKSIGLSTLREVRALVAARWYIQLTGCPPPCNLGEQSDRLADREVDRAARKTIAKMLGHNRIEIMNAYVGAYPRKKYA